MTDPERLHRRDRSSDDAPEVVEHNTPEFHDRDCNAGVITMHALARWHMTKAIRCLADESGRIKERMLIAFVSHLSSIDPDGDLPDELKGPFDRIRMLLSQNRGSGDRGPPATPIEQMTDEEVSEIATELFDLFLRLHGIQE